MSYLDLSNADASATLKEPDKSAAFHSKIAAFLADPKDSKADRIRRLRELLRSSEADGFVKLQSLHDLALLDTESAVGEAEQVIRSGSPRSVEDENLFTASAALLGRMGRAEHLSDIEAAERDVTTEHGKQKIAFAGAMIAHRFGLFDRKFKLPQAKQLIAPKGFAATSFASKEPGTIRRRRAIEVVRVTFPWIEDANQEVREVSCGDRLMEIMLSRELTQGQGLEQIAKQPALPGFVAFSRPDEDTFYPALVVLSDPLDKQRIAVSVRRIDGEPVFVGEAILNAPTGFELALTTVSAPGVIAAAFKVNGKKDGFEITGQSEQRSRVAPNVPQRRAHGAQD